MKNKTVSLILAISSLAIIFLFWLIYFKPVAQNNHSWVAYLPLTNALLNSLCATSLIIGFVQIKAGEKKKHERSMKLAFIFSALFLVSYILYHHFHGDTKFLAQGIVRPIYFFILITHILLSIVSLPMVLYTFALAHQSKWQLHKKWATRTFPLWLYVSVTGVLIFIFIKLFNP